MTKDIKESYIYKSIEEYAIEHNLHVGPVDFFITGIVGENKENIDNFWEINNFISELHLKCDLYSASIFGSPAAEFTKKIDQYTIKFTVKILFREAQFTLKVYPATYSNLWIYNSYLNKLSKFPDELEKFNEWLNQ